jgi:hypothetical protein
MVHVAAFGALGVLDQLFHYHRGGQVVGRWHKTKRGPRGVPASDIDFNCYFMFELMPLSVSEAALPMLLLVVTSN